jgi:Tfp pilus assembly protein FimT
MRDERGFSMLQLIIVVAVIGIVSTFALINFRSSKETIKLQNSLRLLASRLEKARVDAVRRHTTTTLQFTDPSSYNINMDFNNNGSPVTRTYAFEPGVRVFSGQLPTVTFNWRGATQTAGSSCVVTFSVVNSIGNILNVDVSGSGDVTVENNSPQLPSVVYNPINANTNIKLQTAIPGPSPADNTPCMDVSGTGQQGDSGPPSCNIHLSSTSIAIRKNGGSTGSVVVSMSTSVLVTATVPSNLTISPTSQTVYTGSSFSIISKNNARGPFPVTFSSACGSSFTITVNVTN